MFKPEQKTIFVSRPNQQAETIYLVEDKDISDYLEYERSLGNGTVQVLCKNVLVLIQKISLLRLNLLDILKTL